MTLLAAAAVGVMVSDMLLKATEQGGLFPVPTVMAQASDNRNQKGTLTVFEPSVVVPIFETKG